MSEYLHLSQKNTQVLVIFRKNKPTPKRSVAAHHSSYIPCYPALGWRTWALLLWNYLQNHSWMHNNVPPSYAGEENWAQRFWLGFPGHLKISWSLLSDSSDWLFGSSLGGSHRIPNATPPRKFTCPLKGNHLKRKWITFLPFIFRSFFHGFCLFSDPWRFSQVSYVDSNFDLPKTSTTWLEGNVCVTYIYTTHENLNALKQHFYRNNETFNNCQIFNNLITTPSKIAPFLIFGCFKTWLHFFRVFSGKLEHRPHTPTSRAIQSWLSESMDDLGVVDAPTLLGVGFWCPEMAWNWNPIYDKN